jgi:hypothetical protein
MDIMYQQMINTQIACHYYLARDVSIREIPLIEDRAPTYFRAPLVTWIEHFQNDDKARNMARFTMPELC